MPYNDFLRFPCHWDEKRICKNDFLCEGCEYHPADEDKPNGRKPPVPIGWDVSEFGTFPVCPACGEMPYSYTRCLFCGQEFLPDEETERRSKPPEMVRLDCPICGGEGTLVGTRAYCNNHFHGVCENCGCAIMQ